MKVALAHKRGEPDYTEILLTENEKDRRKPAFFTLTLTGHPPRMVEQASAPVNTSLRKKWRPRNA